MSAASPSVSSANERGQPSAHHWAVLAISAGIMVAAALLDVLSGGRVALHVLPNYPLPHLCMSRTLLGVSCPGCGLTRSFVHLAHGDWQAAWQVHHFGWLLAALVIAQLPYRGLLLAGFIRPIGPQVAQWLAITIVGLLVMNWVLSLTIAL